MHVLQPRISHTTHRCPRLWCRLSNMTHSRVWRDSTVWPRNARRCPRSGCRSKHTHAHTHTRTHTHTKTHRCPRSWCRPSGFRSRVRSLSPVRSLKRCVYVYACVWERESAWVYLCIHIYVCRSRVRSLSPVRSLRWCVCVHMYVSTCKFVHVYIHTYTDMNVRRVEVMWDFFPVFQYMQRVA